MMQFELREETPWWLKLTAPIMSIAISLALASVLIVWAGQSAIEGLRLIVMGAFSTSLAITETLARAIPLIFTGLAAAIAFRARFYNIGAEGQLYCGALCATWLGTGMVSLPPTLMIPFLFLSGAVAGGLAILLPWWLKSRLNVDEVVTTLLLNFVILLLVSFALEGPMKDPMAMGWPQAARIIDEGVLQPIVPRSRLHAGIYVALASALVIWLLLRYSLFGFKLRALGLNRDAARHAGINTTRTLLAVALLSGAMAGAAGVSEVAGLKGYLTLDLSPGFGYTGIAVAMLASLHPLGVVLSAVFLAAIYVGADSMGRALGVPSYIADIMVAAAVLSVLIGLMLCKYRVRFSK